MSKEDTAVLLISHEVHALMERSYLMKSRKNLLKKQA